MRDESKTCGSTSARAKQHKQSADTNQIASRVADCEHQQRLECAYKPHDARSIHSDSFSFTHRPSSLLPTIAACSNALQNPTAISTLAQLTNRGHTASSLFEYHQQRDTKNQRCHLRHVLITGRSDGGIGAALALAFHAAGLKVHATARNSDRLSQCNAIAGIETLILDVTSTKSLAAAVSQVPHLDILVNNAGAEYVMPFSDVDIAAARKLFDLECIEQSRGYASIFATAAGKQVAADRKSNFRG